MKKYSHIQFRKHWEITVDCAYHLGECDALVQVISNVPLKPEDRRRLLEVSLIKGAQATTAIEGNTLTEEEVEKIQEGWKLPASREYQEIEVKNVLDSFNKLLEEIIHQKEECMITLEMIKRLHHMIGKNLGEHLDAIPGKFREDNRVVGPYRTPDYQDIPKFMETLCSWLKQEFHYAHGQDFQTSIIQAIVTHVYLEWIHPFGDGNGRTGRLLEFYVLLRAGLPNIVSHVLSNFYNKTRTEYYRQLDQAKKNENLSSFLAYAVQGFRDELNENLKIIQESQFLIFWHNYIYESFAKLKFTKKEAFKRKRELALQMPIDAVLSLDEIKLINVPIATAYAKVGKETVLRDLRELCAMKLFQKEGHKYSANIGLLQTMVALKKR